MNNMKRLLMSIYKKKYALIFLLYICSISYIYIPIFHTYFLHDEWRQIATILEFGPIRALNTVTTAEMLLGKGRIIGTLIYNMFYFLFPFQTTPFLIVVFIGHIINSFILFRIVFRLTHNWKIAFFSGLFFAVSSRHQEALSWIGAGVQIVGSSFFVLLACSVFLSFLEKRIIRYLFSSFFLWYISYLFREQVIFLIPVVGLILLIYLLQKKLIPSFIIYVSMVFFIGLGLFGAVKLFSFDTTNTLSFSGRLLVQKQLLNVLYYPFVSLGQFFLPYRFIYRSAEWMMNMLYPFMNTGGNNETFIHFPLSDLVSSFASFMIIIGIVWMYISYKKMRRVVILAVVFYVASFFPTAFHLIHRYDSLIESRFMYITTPFVALLFGCFVWFLSGYVFRKKRLLGLIVVIAAFIFLGKEMTVARREVNVSAIRGKEMTGFLSSFKKIMPVMQPKTILLIEGDKNFYFEHNTLPFMLGGGYVLSVVYFQDGTIPLSSIKRTPTIEEPLVGFGSQGIVSNGERMFGYYWDRNALRRDIEAKQIDIGQVHAFRYTSGDSQVVDITEEIHTFLSL